MSPVLGPRQVQQQVRDPTSWAVSMQQLQMHMMEQRAAAAAVGIAQAG